MTFMDKVQIQGGHVRSKHDNDLHYVTARDLARLYGLNPQVWIEKAGTSDRTKKDGFVLRPDYEGVYSLRNEIDNYIEKEIKDQKHKIQEGLKALNFLDRLKILFKKEITWNKK